MASRNRGKSKPKLRDLSRIAPSHEEKAAVRDALARRGSAITAAILGASQVEHELETELRVCFRRSDDETWKLMTDDRGPLGTFSQKITAAYAFGIIDDVIKSALDTIRQIRNAFAHTKRLIDFNNELIVQELKKVTLPQSPRSKLYEYLSGVRTVQYGPQAAYVRLCLTATLTLAERRWRRARTREARAAARHRYDDLAKALLQPPAESRTGLRELLGGYRTADPTKTILGEVDFAARDWGENPDDNKDK